MSVKGENLGLWLAITIGHVSLCSSQSASPFHYFYDDNGRLTSVIDASGVQLNYAYDPAGNILQVKRSIAPASAALAILNFTPQRAPLGATVSIEGQNFSSTPGQNAVMFDGVAAPVLTATTTTITVLVPPTATTGLLTVTVNGTTATSSDIFTVVPIPVVLSISPQFTVSSAAVSTIPNLTVTGVNFSGANFSLTPALYPFPVVINSATIDPSGDAATLNLSVAAGVRGSFTLLASNAAGISSPTATSSNTLQIIAPDDDADGDGLTNAVEIAFRSNPLNAQTSGQGISDGWQVFYGLNPLSASSAGPDPGKSGNTALQDYQQGFSPVNPSRVPPAVTQVLPANGATGVPINSVVVARFGEPLRTGTSLAAAQRAIAAALGTNSSVSAASLATAALTLQNYMNRTCCGTTVIPGTVVVSGPYGAITGGVTASSDGLSISFSPTVPLTSNTTYTVQVNGVRDAAGNLMTVPFTSTFTTGATVDNTLPTIKLVDPENNSTGVPTNAHYTVQFSKAIDPGTLSASTFTIYDQTAQANLGGTLQVDASLTTASFIPDQPLPVGRNFTVTFTTGIKDTSGNVLASSSTYYFSTGYNPETAAPHFVASSPVSGATGIPVNAIIDLQFSQPLNITTVVPNITVSTGGQAVPVQTALSGGDERVTMTPLLGLQPDAQYTVTVGAGIANIAGARLDNAGSFSFQTAALVDTDTLRVISWAPASNATGVALNAQVRAGFSKQVDVVSLGSGNVVLYPAGLGSSSPISGAISSSDQRSVTFSPMTALQAETQYCFGLSNVVDLEGNGLSGSVQGCFTTGSSVQSSGPVVVGISPGTGSLGVPVNAVVEVGLSEPVSAVSVGQTAITVSAGGQAVAGTVTVANATTLLFTPSSSLAVSTAYTVSVGGFTDLAGNAATAFTSGFTTSSSSTPVETGPAVVSVSPADRATNVAVTSPIVVTFSAAVNPLTVTNSSLLVQANGNVIAGTYGVNGAGTVVTFTPLTALPGSTTIQVSVNYEGKVQDVAGNNVSNSSITSFMTAAMLDTTAPTVLSVTPSNGQTGVGLNGQVVVLFSKSMNPSTLTTNTIALLAGDVKQSFSTSVSGDNRTLTLYNLSLPGSTVVTLAISSGATDLSGNALANYTSQFTTVAAFDTTHGSVVNQRPAAGATGVLTTASPVVLFLNKALNASTISNNTVQVTQNGQLVSGTLTVVGNGQTLEFTPNSAWTYGALVQVFLDATALDTVGNTVNAYTGSFTVVNDPAVTAPALVNVSPMSGSTAVPLNVTLDAQYSAPLDPTTVTARNVSLYNTSTGTTISSVLTLDSTGTIIHLTPNAVLAANTYYSFYLSNLKGTNGLSAANSSESFTTGAITQTVAPTVQTVSPANHLGNVPVNANIGVVFSGPIDPVTVTGGTIMVSGGGMTAVPASISFSNSNQRVQITPEAPLPVSTLMAVTISGVTDVAGNVVPAFTSSFTTGAGAATTAPGFVVTNPASEATGVPVNAAISLQANAAIDGTTLNSSSFLVHDNTLNVFLSGTYSLSADGMTMYFVPATQLATGRTYTVYASNYYNYYYSFPSITDVAGNTISATSYTFTTGFAASTTAPQVTGVSPAAGLTQVPINAQIVVSFSEPVNGESLTGVTLSANGSTVSLSTVLSSGNQLLTITPVAGLLPNTAYTLTVNGVADLAGNTMTTPTTSSFTTSGTVDLNPLTIVSISPVSGSTGVPLNAQVRVGFFKGVNLVSLSGGNLMLYPSNEGSSYPVAGTLSVSSDGKSVTFTPRNVLQAETQYCFGLSNVVDLEGNGLSGSVQGCFTTGSSVQSSGPVVVGISPGTGSLGVPVNAVVEVGLSEPVSAVSVGQTAITVSAGGQAVAGTVTVANATTLLFTPSSSLAVSTAYTVSVGGFTDLAGNAATAFTSGFTTSSSSTPVETGPAVVSVSPADRATNVAVTSPIVVTFSAAVNPLTVTNSSLLVQANGNVIAGTYGVNGAGTVVTFTPLTALPGSTTIQVSVNYEGKVQDVAGNNVSNSSITSFMTAAMLDTTAPTVLSVTPSNGQTGVGLNGQVVVLFSKSMNPSTLTTNTIALLAGDVKQSFSTSVSGDNRTLTLYNLSLPGSTVVTLAISSGATDLSGNALANYTSQFTTVAAFDTTHGSVVNQRPAAGATGVLTTASPVVLFLNKALNASTISNNTVQVTQNGQLVSGTLTVVGNGQTLEFTPNSAWTYGALVQVFLDATALDTVGNTVNAYTGSFTVVNDPAVTAPALVNVSPMSGSTAVPLNVTLDAQYSAPLDPTTVTARNVSLYNTSTGTTISSVLTLDSTGTIIHLTPNAVLAANTYYSFYLSNLKGTNGLSAANSSESFTTGAITQTVAPTVQTVSPANHLGNVPVNANIGVVFSGPIDPVTVTGGTIMVSGGGMTAVPASISFSNSNQRVQITPEAPLPVSTLMAVTISGVTDVAGNVVPAFTSSFTTGAGAATTAPGFVVTNPASEATGVPVNAAISLQANAAIDGTTLNSSSFLVHDNTLNVFLSGTYSLSADGMTMYFVPATQLATGRTYTVYASNYYNYYYSFPSITDVAGNTISATSYTFTTGFAASTTAPQVTGVSPAAGLTQVPINAQIVVSFSEPVNGESLTGVTLSANGSTVSLSTVLSSGNQLLTITPVAGLLPNTAYTLTVNGVADLAGNTMTTPTTSSFTTSGTVDLNPLTIVSISPVSGSTGVPLNAQVRVGFFKGVNLVSLSGGNLMLYPSNEGSSYPVAGTLSVSSDGKSVTFTPRNVLQAETQYCFGLSNVVDLEGNGLSGSVQGCFTTGSSVQSSGPVVVGISPGTGSLGVPVNAVVEVGLSEPVSAVSVGQTAITVSAGGQAVAGTVTVANATTLLFTPSSSLAVSTAYTVSVGGFTDLAGNAATAFTSGFTTSSSSTPVETGPAVVSVSPADRATNVAVTSPIVVTFSAAVNPLTVTNSSLLVQANGNVIAGTYGVNGAGTVVTFTPLTALPGSTTIQVSVNYEGKVQDVAGNNVSNSSITSFMTAAMLDTTAPTVLSVTPSNGQTGVGLNGQVVVLFSKSMNPSTLTTNTIALLAGDVKQSFSTSVSGDNRTLTLYNLSLPGSTVVTLAISSGATDLSGNALANYTSQFTTVAAFDTTHGSVVNQRPAAGATGVLTTASPVVLFLNKALNASTISNNTVQVTQNGQLVSGTLTVVGNGQTLEFTPNSAWTYGALVQVFLDATALDTVGNTVNAYTGSFTVVNDPAVTAPALVNVSPMSGSTAVPLNVTLDAQYSAPLDPTTVTARNVSLYNTSTGTTISSVLTLDSTGTIIHLTPNAVLAANTYYSFYLSNLKGTNGLSAANSSESFTTGAITQTVAPTVQTVSPANHLGNVPVNANIGVVFSGPIDPVTVTGGTIMVSGGGMTAVPASISFSNSNQRVQITPEAPLPVSTLMAVTISGVTDVAGNVVPAFTSSFTTGAGAATTAPGFVVTNPASEATGVPVNAAISLQANAAIDGTTLNSSSFLVHDNTLNVFLSGTYSLSADGMTMYFVPATQLATGRTYTVYASNYYNYYYSFPSITDVAGNTISATSYTFTTGFAASTTAPQVTGVSPAAGLTQVPINAQIVVSFSEPVNGESLTGVTLSANGSTVSLSTVLSSGNQLLTITPVAGLLPNTAYTLTVNGVADLAGNTMTTPTTSSFTTSGTVDLNPLTIVSISPVSGSTGVPLNAQVRVGFFKGVNLVSLSGGNLMLYPSNEGSSYPVAGTLSVSSDGKSVTFTPRNVLQAETQYCFGLSNVVDLEGNGLSGSVQGCFTTGSSVQSSGPVVVGISPGTGSLGVPVNAVVEVGLSEPVSAVSVGQTAITVSAGGQAVAGTVTVANATTLLFTPSSSLAVSTAYTVSVGGFTDLAGNAATAFTSGFTTSSSSTPVETGPAVVSVSPADRATNVAVTSPIVVTFSAAVNPLTVTNSSLLVQANGNVIAGTYGVNGAGTVVTFTPLTALPGSTTIQVSVNYEGKVQDVAGNNVSNSSITSFMTAAMLDTTAPTVLSVTPSNGQTGVGLNGQVVVLFSKSMNPSTLTGDSTTSNLALLAGEMRQSFSASVSSDNRTVVLSGLSLPASTEVTLAIPHTVTDLSGNALADFTSQFTTAAAFDTTHASVVNQRPGNGATGVLTTASPVVLFLNKPLNASTVPGAVHVSENGQLVSGTAMVVGNGQTVEFTPSSPWSYGSLVQVFLDTTASDLSGNAVTAYTGKFSTVSDPATTASAVLNYSPMNGATGVPLNAVVDVVYSEALDPTTVTSTNVYLSGPSGTVPSTPTLDPTGTVIHLTPSAVLAANTRYCFYAQNVQGTNGTAAQNPGSCFTTGAVTQTVAPTVLTVSPADNLGNVPVNANIGVVFSGPIDPVTVTGATIMVSGGGMTSIPASISFSNNNKTVEITPQAPLPASTMMTLIISGVKDVAGNAVASQTTHFTTGAGAATTTPGFVVTNPVSGATGVPVNAAISLQANAAIDGTTVNSSTFQVYDNTLNTYLTGTYSLSADGMTAYFVPATQLATGRAYTVYASSYSYYYPSSAMTDVAGNTISGTSYTFTTGFAASTAAPQVTGVSPANGLTQVPINAQIVVSFSEPVNGESLAGVTLAANGSTVLVSRTLSSGSQLLTIVPTAGLTAKTSYTLTVAGVADLSGNVMTTPTASTFTTSGEADLRTLTVTAVTPSNNATTVLTTMPIQVQFNKMIDELSASSQNVKLSTNGTTFISTSLTFNQEGTVMTITPTIQLGVSTMYSVQLTPGILDLEGTSLTAFQSVFTTGPK